MENALNYMKGHLHQTLRKLCLKIGLTAVVLLSVSSVLQADVTHSQHAKINLALENVTLPDVFREIEKQSEYRFFYNRAIVDTQSKLSIRTGEKELPEVLNQLFGNTDMNYKLVDKYIVINHKDKTGTGNPGLQQATDRKSISGRITDAQGEAVIGANVVEAGTTNGTVTDIDGRFTLEISAGASLHVSYIGYVEQTVSTAGKDVIDVILREDTKALEEVVVVGYGVQKKANLTGSVSTVKYNQELENRPITNPSQALSGKVSGVWASQNSGAPGADGATIRVRGYGTLNNTDPMILIDGVEGRMSDVNPSDIASITVLKDAASAAIYGSRAANGVVLIETKKGEGEQVRINYNGYFGVQQLGRKYDLITDSPHYMQRRGDD